MTKEYLFISPQFDGEIMFRYDNNHLLVAYEVRAVLSSEQLIYLMQNFPLHLAHLDNLSCDKSRIKEVKYDFSFENFWSKYKYKVGNKKRTERLWAKLTDGEKLLVFEYIPKYDRYLIFRNIEKCYPETFLYQRRWESQLPKF